MADSASSSAQALALEVLGLAAARDLKIMVAESLTGGLLASTLVAIPGASRVFLGGIVAYSNEAKRVLLGIEDKVLTEFGAVSPEVAGAMATGLGRGFPRMPLIKVATTGVAGPDSQEGQPVGRVYIGVSANNRLRTTGWLFQGSRTQIREQAVVAALELLRDEIQGHHGL